MIKVMKLYYIVKPLYEDEIEVMAIAGPFFTWGEAMADKQNRDQDFSLDIAEVVTTVKIC
jgi:hypothetical protein